jgi:hypothetical protein
MKLILLKELFAGFLSTRHFGRHFRRLALIGYVAFLDPRKESAAPASWCFSALSVPFLTLRLSP